MNIGSIQSFGPINDATSAIAATRVPQAQADLSSGSTTEESFQTDSPTSSRQGSSGTAHAPAAAEFQDEVQVQRDSQIEDQVVIKYLNQNTGALILQVPSPELLNVDRAIHQEIEQQAKLRETPGTGSAGTEGEDHGY